MINPADWIGRVWEGHVLDVLADLPAESIHCCVTSSPYWGLRKYAGEQEVTWPDGSRSAFGLEPTIELYVEHTIEILRTIRRVLRKDGTVWWNIGDSYLGSWGNYGARNGKQRTRRKERYARDAWEEHGGRPPMATTGNGTKPKDMALIPFRVALAAQADGWWVRSVIVWDKPNPMPESVKDRPTLSHEYILLLTKSAKYWYDADAIREPLSPLTLADSRNATGWHTQGNAKGSKYAADDSPEFPSWYRAKTFVNPDAGRNCRSVWRFATQPYPGAHFAVFPEELPRRCILAGCPPKVCGKCGAGWVRALADRGKIVGDGRAHPRMASREIRAGSQETIDGVCRTAGDTVSVRETIGWRPSCQCGCEETQPGIVLDPFAGSGTTLAVAERLGRRWVGIEIAQEYLPMIDERIARERAQGKLPVEVVP